MKRRNFLKRTALAGASGIVTTGIHGSWAWRGAAAAAIDTPRLIVIFLRGAVDGLDVVVPYREDNYYELRPSIAIAPPGKANSALDLDGQFGLHPALAGLMPEWEAGRLAFVHASGLPVVERSHFQAQANMETGTFGIEATPDGWLNRLLGVLPVGSVTQAVSLSDTMPLIFSGAQSVTSLAVGARGSRPLSIDQVQIQTAFDQLYANDNRVGQVYQEGRQARSLVLQALDEEVMAASQRSANSSQLEISARSLAQLMVSDTATQVAFMEWGQWDTHVNQRANLNRQLGLLGNGLKALTEALGPVYQNTTIVVVSEFGRTVAENGGGGTEHGHGNALWLMGGGIQGQQIYGEWPGLATTHLHQSRDLAITTDFRDVLTSLLSQHFSLSASSVAQVFPGYQPQKAFQFL